MKNAHQSLLVATRAKSLAMCSEIHERTSSVVVWWVNSIASTGAADSLSFRTYCIFGRFYSAGAIAANILAFSEYPPTPPSTEAVLLCLVIPALKAVQSTAVVAA